MKSLNRPLPMTAWRTYLACGFSVLIGYYVAKAIWGDPNWVIRTSIYGGINLSAVVALIVGVRIRKPVRRLPWLFIIAAQALYAAGDFMFYTLQYGFGVKDFPGPYDVLYLAHYPLIITGILLFILRRDPGRNRTALADASLIGIGVALLSWVFLISPYTATPELPTSMRLTAVAYPLADIVLMAMAVRLVVGGGFRPTAYWILNTGLGLVLLADSVYAWQQLHGVYVAGGYTDFIWMSSYLVLGATALHPSMVHLTDRQAVTETPLTPLRLATLTVATSAAPLLLLGHAHFGLGGTDLLDETVIAVASMAMFGLVVFRLRELVRAKGVALAESVQARLDLAVVEEQRSRLLTQLVQAGEDERKRLAATLHDGPIQRLTALGLGLARVALLGARNDSEGATRVMASVQAGLSDEIEDLRRTMTELRPPALDESGLAAAIRDHIEHIENAEAIECSIESTLVARPRPAVETALYRVAQEALTNVIKHANARHVNVFLDADAGSIVLEVRDDGSGYDIAHTPSAPDKAWQHFGVSTMRERVEALGGSMVITSAPSRGTTVKVAVPAG